MVVGDRLLYPDPTYRDLRRSNATIARYCACNTNRPKEIYRTNLARYCVVDSSGGCAFGSAARSHDPYLHRRRGCAIIVGAATCALSSNPGYCFSNLSSDSALARYQCPTVFHPWFGCHLRCCLNRFDRLPDRDPPCRVFCMRFGLPRRTRAASAGASIPHRLLCVDLRWRVYRRHCYWLSRASRVQLGRRISTSDRAGCTLSTGTDAASDP